MNDKNYKLISFTEDGLSLDVRVDAEKETVWLTQAEMAELFDVNVDTIGLHLRNIYREGELETSTSEESSVVRFEGKRGEPPLFPREGPRLRRREQAHRRLALPRLSPQERHAREGRWAHGDR